MRDASRARTSGDNCPSHFAVDQNNEKSCNQGTIITVREWSKKQPLAKKLGSLKSLISMERVVSQRGLVGLEAGSGQRIV
ncbi:hypothetical protein VTO42DRAFT_5697 [Malbranchea cinnamomea]